MWIYSQGHHSQASWFTSHVLLEFWYEKWMLHDVMMLHKFDLVEIWPVSSNVAGKFWNLTVDVSLPRLMTPGG